MSTTTSSPITSPFATRPDPSEYLAYYGRYISQVPDGDLLATLEAQFADTVMLLTGIGEAGAATRYAEGKWSVKQVVGHLADAERIFMYRALCAARGEIGGLPSFDENRYVDEAHFDDRSLNALLGELTAARRATLALLHNLDEGETLRCVTANGTPISVRALAWITAGHERHHATIVRERYLPAIH